MFHTVVQRGFSEMARSKYYIYFADNLSLYPTPKQFSKLVNSWRSYCKNATPRFLRHSVVEEGNHLVNGDDSIMWFVVCS